jgi:hypothetical protein
MLASDAPSKRRDPGFAKIIVDAETEKILSRAGHRRR